MKLPGRENYKSLTLNILPEAKREDVGDFWKSAWVIRIVKMTKRVETKMSLMASFNNFFLGGAETS